MKLPEKNTDGAAQQTCACMLTENFFADYGDSDAIKRFKGSKESVEVCDGTSTSWCAKENGKYLCGEGWLLDEEGINAIASAHVEAIKRYIDSV